METITPGNYISTLYLPLMINLPLMIKKLASHSLGVGYFFALHTLYRFIRYAYYNVYDPYGHNAADEVMSLRYLGILAASRGPTSTFQPGSSSSISPERIDT